MTDLIEEIGPYLGIAAFLGLAILAFLIFQQAREVRRLREWAGRAPERADEAAEAAAAAAEAKGEEPEIREEAPDQPGRLGHLIGSVRDRAVGAYGSVDRRSPFDLRYLLVVIAAGIVAAGVLTSGFGLVGGDDGAGNGQKKDQKPEKEEKIEVSVLNATQDDTGPVPIAGVQGLAGEVAKEVVKPAGFKVGEKADATSGFETSVIMHEPGEEGAAQELAAAVADQLGETDVQPIVPDIADLAGGAPVVLVVGQDDAEALGPPPG